MKDLQKKYNTKETEEKWQKYWKDNNIFKFNWKDTKRENIFSIDTPPPTVSGVLHMGHIFSYSQADFIARYWRMRGKNVYYPIGFDDNGLPTERYIEKIKGIKGRETPHKDFVNICKENIDIAEDKFEDLFRKIAYSYDWDEKYQSVSDESKRISQMSFLDLYEKGALYQKESPCIWDVVDGTALAQSELEDEELESQMNYLQFTTEDGEPIEIMTTRPELLPACVALMCHPSNFEKYKGKNVITPLGVKVPIIADEKVDKEKGTGFVMCCTFGDQTDIEWWKKHNLDLRIIISEIGKIKLDVVKDLINQDYLELNGLKIKDARAKILEILEKNGKITRNPEKIVHPVKIGERSKFPIEFLVVKQWFIKVLDIKDKLHEKASEINWHPKWTESRIHDWIDGLSWDWCISRQRFFGIPLPVWYSKRKGEEGKVLLPKKEQLPVDPVLDLPDGYTREEVEAETDVLDTWATSSVSPNLCSQGINENYYSNKEKFEALGLPFDMRSHAHEIIRTWTFSSLVKAYYHQNTIPWKNLEISGWCLATDGSKMSKSKGNIIDPLKLIDEKGVDAIRYWTGSATLGLDTSYSNDVITVGQKLITKIFNAAKFAEMHLKNFDVNSFEGLQNDLKNNKIFTTVDLCLIERMKEVLKEYNNYFENYEYYKALNVVENFFWDDFCDNYLEIVKVRCYGASGIKYEGMKLTMKEELAIDIVQGSAVGTIYYIFNYLLKLFAPFLPYICEEVYSCVYEEEFNKFKSIHSRGNGVKDDFVVNMDTKNQWTAIKAIVEKVRKYKSEKKISIKEKLECIYVEGDYGFNASTIEDLKDVCNAELIVFDKSSGVGNYKSPALLIIDSKEKLQKLLKYAED